MGVLIRCSVGDCKREAYKNGECIIHSKIETKSEKLLRSTVRDECYMGEYNFFGTISYQDFSLNNLKILKNANINFSDSFFYGTFRAKEIDLFTSKIDFTGTQFDSEINIELCNIFGYVLLREISAIRRVSFSLNDFEDFEIDSAKFNDKVKIVNSVFKKSFSCKNTVFKREAIFLNTYFFGETVFENVIFEEAATFNLCEFHSNAVFKNVLFKKDVNIKDALSKYNLVIQNSNIF